MRLRHLILWDMKFQKKYGFYLLYGFLTLLYIIVLSSLPKAWRVNVTALLIFSDPAAMGLFFMGAIVLFEKSQRIPCAFAISPLRATEYIISKVVSLNGIALVVATLLAIPEKISSLPYVLLGTALSGIQFTLLGIIIATKITSLNQFLLLTLPIEILGFIPAILHLFNISPSILNNYPANVCIAIIAEKPFSMIGLLCVVILIFILFIIAHKCVLKMWKNAGGIKL